MEFQDRTRMALLQSVGSILTQKDPRIVAIGPDEPVYNAVGMMADHDIGALPVLDHGRLVGMISERDYARKIILEGRSSRTTRVGEIMDTADLVVAPETAVGQCLEVMTRKRRRHLLVLDAQGMLAGIVSIGDLVNAIIAAQDNVIVQLHDYIVGAYPS